MNIGLAFRNENSFGSAVFLLPNIPPAIRFVDEILIQLLAKVNKDDFFSIFMVPFSNRLLLFFYKFLSQDCVICQQLRIRLQLNPTVSGSQYTAKHFSTSVVVLVGSLNLQKDN